MSQIVHFTINGREVEVVAKPELTLLDVIRVIFSEL